MEGYSGVTSRMDQYAGAIDLPILSALATALRRLAGDSLCRGDQALYLLTAEVLEMHAERLAAALPPQSRAQPHSPALHQPVDLTI